MMFTRFFPMSCLSPLTVPMTTVPTCLGAGLGQQGAQHLKGTSHRFAGDEHFGNEEITALEPGARLFNGRDEGLVQQRLRASPMPGPVSVSSSTAGSLPVSVSS